METYHIVMLFIECRLDDGLPIMKEKLRGRTSTCRDGSRAICLSSSYVWSERWSEKPEVCWFDSDLRHQGGCCRLKGSVQYLNSVFLFIRKLY